MTDEAALLKAIVANPDEDTPRLAYADWLDENAPDATPSPAAGPSARAEFVRAQCRLAAGAFDAPDYPELLERELDLADWLSTHARHPDEPLFGTDGDTRLQVGEWAECRRGFNEAYCFEDYGSSADETLDSLIPALESAFRRTPGRTLVLDGATTEEVERFAAHRAFRHLRGLYIDYLDEGDEDPAVAAIAGSQHAAGLRRLYLDLMIGEDGCRALAESRHLGNLEALVIDFPISARSLKFFHGVKWFRNLRRLHLWSGWGGRSDVLRALADFPPMPRLVSLTLDGLGNVSAAAVRKLVGSEAFPKLAHLELSGNGLQQDAVASLAKAKWPLRHLALEQGHVRRAGCEALAGAAFARTLRVLSLRESEVTAGGVQALAEAKSLAGLRNLDLSGNPIGPGGLAALAASKTLTGLRALNLGRTNHARWPLAARHVVEFLSSLNMPELRHLNLAALPVAVRGARVLATDPGFTNLTRLQLESCALGNAGTAALAESKTLANLTHLDLFGNKVGSGAGKLANVKVFPRLGYCRLGHGIPSKTAWRITRRPGVVL